MFQARSKTRQGAPLEKRLNGPYEIETVVSSKNFGLLGRKALVSVQHIKPYFSADVDERILKKKKKPSKKSTIRAKKNGGKININHENVVQKSTYNDGDITLEDETVIGNRNDEDEDVELCSNKLTRSDGNNMEEASLKDLNLVSDENDNNESGFVPGKKQKIARECSSAGDQLDDEEQQEPNRAKFVS